MEDAPREATSSARAAGSTRSIASTAPDHFGVNVFCLEDEARRHCCRRRPHKQKRRLGFRKRRSLYSNIERGRFLVLGRPGSDLLSQGLSHSTIGAEAFNGRVRDGIGLRRFAKTTRPAKDKKTKQAIFCWRLAPSHFILVTGLQDLMDTENESNQADRTISTGKLHALLHFHTRPINVVVFHGSQGNARFEVGFPLRCFQRLSRPYIAMLHCRWRDNSSTRGTFTPVLSY